MGSGRGLLAPVLTLILVSLTCQLCSLHTTYEGSDLVCYHTSDEDSDLVSYHTSDEVVAKKDTFLSMLYSRKKLAAFLAQGRRERALARKALRSEGNRVSSDSPQVEVKESDEVHAPALQEPSCSSSEPGPPHETKADTEEKEEPEYIATVNKRKTKVTTIYDIWEDQGYNVKKFKAKHLRGRSSRTPAKKWKGIGPFTTNPFSEQHPCCKKPCSCAAYFERNVEKWRTDLKEYSEHRSKSEILAWVKHHQEQNQLPGRPAPNLTKLKYCTKFKCWWTGIKKNQFYPETRRVLKPGARADKEISILAWIGDLLPTLECMPDTRQYHVAAPHWRDVYKWFLCDVKTSGGIYKECSKSYFHKIRRRSFPMLKLRKVLRFSKCETCVTLREKCWNRKINGPERQAARDELQGHYCYVKIERGEALRKGYMGVVRPTECLSMAQDATSQLIHGLPQFGEAIKGEDQYPDRLHHHFTLTMVHGLGTKCYVTRDNVASDPNLSIECIQRTLKWVEEVRGKLPPRLYLQLDNCPRENKNSYLINYMVTLAERGLFKEGIEIAFLPVGHTHNEVDQVASRISIAVRGCDIHTPTALYKLLEDSYEDMDVQLIQKVANSKEFLNPKQTTYWAHSRYKQVQNISEAFYFRLSVNERGHVQCSTKTHAREQWSRPFYNVKGTGNEQSRAKLWKKHKRCDLPSDGYSKNVVVLKGHATNSEEKYMLDVMEALKTCKGRVSDEEWLELMTDYNTVFKSEPTDFHWKDGGKFATEDIDPDQSSDDDSEEEDVIEATPARAIFQHHKQVKTHRKNPEPSHIKKGMYVALRANSPSSVNPSSLVTLPPPTFGFRVAEVMKVDKQRNIIYLQYYVPILSGNRKSFTNKVPFFPVQRQGVHHPVPGNEPFLVMSRLNMSGTLSSAYVRTIKYLLRTKPSDQPVYTNLSFPGGLNVDLVQPYDEDHINEYMDDHLDEGLRTEEQSDIDDYDEGDEGDEEEKALSSSSSSSSYSSSSTSSSSSSSACPGTATCTCNMEATLQVGDPECRVCQVFNHNSNRARLQGTSWNREREWLRLSALTIAESIEGRATTRSSRKKT